MKTLYNSLSLITLNEDGNKRTCDYWYLIQNHCSPHVAFHSRASLLLWMMERGLSLTAPLPAHGIFSTQPISGTYYDESHYTEKAVAAFDAITSYFPARQLDNGNYTEAKITTENGIKVVHFLNCNEKRHVFDYWESRDLVG